MSGDFLYHRIANGIAGQIRTGVLKKGDRLPSVRMLCKEHAVSINTAKRVFLELEAQALVEAKPKSGYFVSALPYRRPPLPEVSRPSSRAYDAEPDEWISKVWANMGNDALTLLSISAPSGQLLPLAKLQKEIRLATDKLRDGGTGYEPLQGNAKLRSMVAIRSLTWEGNLHEDDLVTTNGAINAVALCLMTVGKPGDTLAIESPCYPGILQLAVSLGFKVLELPTHPVTGLEMDALKAAIPKIDLCLLVPNFNTPLGSCMPDEHKKEIVALLSAHNIPLIEDDIYGELYFDGQHPKCCKSFDTEGNVLWCSSVSKTLAPGYRVGWVAPGRYKEKLLKQKLIHAISSAAVIEESVGNFGSSGKYESHLRGLRRTLQDNCHHYIQAVAEYFPEGTRTTRPRGGLALWVELGKHIDTKKLYDRAIQQRISIAPGRMFTLQNQFENCMRLCIGLPWSEELKHKLKQLGTLVKKM